MTNEAKKFDQEEEEQTRELQVEQGFKIFQRALDLQKLKQFQESVTHYKQLFGLDVLKPRADESLTPSIKLLRYLAHKNRGLLTLSILQHKYGEAIRISRDNRTFSLADKEEDNTALIILDDNTSNQLIMQIADDSIVEKKKPAQIAPSTRKTEKQCILRTISKDGNVIDMDDDGDSDDEKEELLENLLNITSDLIDSLGYSDTADDDLIDVLFDLFMYFKSSRLARLLLEDQLFTLIEDADFAQNLGFIDGKGETPSISVLHRRLQLVLNTISTKNPAMNSRKDSRTQRKLHKNILRLEQKLENDLFCFNNLKKSDKETKRENLNEIDKLIISLKSRSVSELISKIEGLYENINKPSRSSRGNSSYCHDLNVFLYGNSDPLLSDNFDTTDKVIVHAPTKSTEEMIEESVEFIEQVENNEDVEKLQRKKEPQRSSKRFRSLEGNTSMNIESFTELNDELKKFEFTFGALGIKSDKDEIAFDTLVQRFVDEENTIEPDDRDYEFTTVANQLIHDFNTCLKNWDKQKSVIILGINSKKLGTQSKGIPLLDIFDTANNTLSEKINTSSETMPPQCNLGGEKIYENFFETLLDVINSNNFNSNIYQIRLFVLINLFSQQDIIDGCEYNLITDHMFGVEDDFIVNVKKYIDYYQQLIYNKLCQVFYWRDIGENFNFQKYIIVIVAIFENFVDEYLALSVKQLSTILSKELNQRSAGLAELRTKIGQWQKLLQQFISAEKNDGIKTKTWFRYKWALFLYKQRSLSLDKSNHVASNLNKAIRGLLQELLLEHGKLPRSIDIPYKNYPHFPILSKSTIEDNLKRVKILNSFSRIFKNDSNSNITDDAENVTTYSAETIKLLDLVLQSESSPLIYETLTEDQQLIYDFVQDSPFDFQLKLYEILLEHYYWKAAQKDSRNGTFFELYQENFEKLIAKIIDYLHSDTYTKAAENDRHTRLLKLLSYYGEHTNRFACLLEKGNWLLPKITTPQHLLNMVQIIGVIKIFYLNKISVDLTGVGFLFPTLYPRAAQELQNMICNSYVLLYVYLKLFLLKVANDKLDRGEDLDFSPERKLVDIVSNMHAILGYGSMCNSANRIFLNLLQNELLLTKNVYVDLEIFQLVHCKYHLLLTTDYFEPYDHNTLHDNVDRNSALELTGIFLKLALGKKDRSFSNIKSDLKLVLDAFYEAIGDPNMKYEKIARSDAVIETFLDSSLNAQIFHEAFYGLLNINLSKTNLDIQEVANAGLYYAQGAMALSLFKIRKRSQQGRSAELDFVIKMFKADLLCGTNRLESWILLGQSYSFLVEDDLIWTSDKLNSDKKNNTAISQKKALLCYLMAVNTCAHMDECELKDSSKMVSLLWTLFSKELYSSCMKPMDKLCYKLSTTPKLLSSPNGFYETHFEKPMRDFMIQKIVLLAFRASTKFNHKDWSNFYYIANLQAKLAKKSLLAVETLLKSCELAKRYGGSSDPIIEPHYRLCSLIYKATKKKDITVDDAIEYLKKDNDFFQYKFPEGNMGGTFEEQFMVFAGICIDLQKRILSHDKKKWHHKPHYRIAKIFFYDFGDIEAAKKEMMNVITLKLTNKNLVSIWKPENERPGKHFIYAFEYVNFFVLLLEKSNCLSSLCITLKKLRRMGSGMVNMLTAWENACQTTCSLVRNRLNIAKNYTDSVVSKLVFKTFTDHSQDFLNALKSQGVKIINTKDLLLLYEVSEVRRMNNGFGTTALIDDTFAAIYLRMYQTYLNANGAGKEYPKEMEKSNFVFDINSTESTTSSDQSGKPTNPAPTKTKVARRDIYPRAIAILKLLAKDIEILQRENELVFDADQNEELKTESNLESSEKNGDDIQHEEEDIPLQDVENSNDIQILLDHGEVGETLQADKNKRVEIIDDNSDYANRTRTRIDSGEICVENTKPQVADLAVEYEYLSNSSEIYESAEENAHSGLNSRLEDSQNDVVFVIDKHDSPAESSFQNQQNQRLYSMSEIESQQVCKLVDSDSESEIVDITESRGPLKRAASKSRDDIEGNHLDFKKAKPDTSTEDRQNQNTS